MKKLVKGIVEFRQNTRPEFIKKFSKLALGQSPDTLFIACSDSRVVPNAFVSTDPGDLFVIRNVGNMVPAFQSLETKSVDHSEFAAIEFAILKLKVKDIIVCGHSDCGAMHAILNGREKVTAPSLREWLKHGENSLKRMNKSNSNLNTCLSQANVLEQIEHIKSYPEVIEKVQAGSLKIHGWWFDLATASVYAYETDQNKFILIDEAVAEKILESLT